MITIKIGDKEFNFHSSSKIVADNGTDATVTEPEYDDETGKKNPQFFTEKRIHCSVGLYHKPIDDLLPCSRVYTDANGNKKFAAYFD